MKSDNTMHPWFSINHTKGRKKTNLSQDMACTITIPSLHTHTVNQQIFMRIMLNLPHYPINLEDRIPLVTLGEW